MTALSTALSTALNQNKMNSTERAVIEKLNISRVYMLFYGILLPHKTPVKRYLIGFIEETTIFGGNVWTFL